MMPTSTQVNDPLLWGHDAGEFNYERFMQDPIPTSKSGSCLFSWFWRRCDPVSRPTLCYDGSHGIRRHNDVALHDDTEDMEMGLVKV